MFHLAALYQSKTGKVSDKWDLYLTLYDHLLEPYRALPTLRLLEIGVQNGGSLETWAQFFPLASKIIGSDINPECANLVFDDPRISVVIGDSATAEVRESIVSVGGVSISLSRMPPTIPIISSAVLFPCFPW